MSLTADDLEQVLSVVEGALSEQIKELQAVRSELESLKQRLLPDKDDEKEEVGEPSTQSIRHRPAGFEPNMDFLRIDASAAIENYMAKYAARIFDINQTNAKAAAELVKTVTDYRPSGTLGDILRDIVQQTKGYEDMAKRIRSLPHFPILND